MPVGIAYIRPHSKGTAGEDNVIYTEEGKGLTFYAELHQDTKNKRTSKRAIKWVWVAAEHLPKLKTMHKKAFFEHWGKWQEKNKKEVAVYGIGKDYGGTGNVQVGISGEIGKLYWLEAFLYYPEFKFPVGKYFTLIGEPQILETWFIAATLSNQKTIPKARIGEVFTLNVKGHRIPDMTSVMHNYTVFEVDLYDQLSNKKLNNKPKIYVADYTDRLDEVNHTIEIHILAQHEWLDKLEDKSDTAYHTIYAKIKATNYYNKGATFQGKTEMINSFPYAVGAKFTTYSPNGQLIAVEIEKEDWVKEHWLEYFLGRSMDLLETKATTYTRGKEIVFNTQQNNKTLEKRYIHLLKTTKTEALAIREMAVNNMLAEVKKQTYTVESFESCRFSAIEVRIPNEVPIEIFNENKKEEEPNSGDAKIHIIGGDTKSKINVFIKNLEVSDLQTNSKGQPNCLLETPHSTNSLIDSKKVQPQWLVPKSEQKEPNWNTYTIEKNKITLELGYYYNKSIDSNAKKWLGNEVGEFVDDLLDYAWITRYFFNFKDIGQKYSIPISTCAYTKNVEITVYPDFEWWLNFKFNFDNALYVRQTPNYKYRVFTVTKNQNQKKAGALRSEKSRVKKNRDFGDYTIDFEVGCKANGSEYTQWSLSNGFSAMKYLNFVLHAYQIMEDLFFTKRITTVLDEQVSLGKAVRDSESVSVSNGKIANPDQIPPPQELMSKRAAQRKGKGLPVRFSLSKPSFAAGVHFRYERGKVNNKIVSYFGEIKAEAKPLTKLEGRLDLLFFAQFCGPIGAIIGKINKVFDAINFFTMGAIEIDYYLDLVGSVEANIAVSGNYHGVEGFDGDFTSTLPIKIGIESGGHIKYSLIRTEGGAILTADAMANFRVNVVNDKRSRKYQGTLMFDGLKATFTLKFFRNERLKGGDEKETHIDQSGQGNEILRKEVEIIKGWEKPITFDF